MRARSIMSASVDVFENGEGNEKGRDDNPRPSHFTFDACPHCISPIA